MPEPVALMEWQRGLLAAEGIDPEVAQELLAQASNVSAPELSIVGTAPTPRGGDVRIAVDADCPACGWPERYFDTGSRTFGCIKCPYTSDERNA